MTDTIDVQLGNSADEQADPPEPTGRRGRVAAAACVFAAAATVAVASGVIVWHATSAPPPAAGTSETPAATACLSGLASIPSGGPPTSTPAARMTSQDVIPVNAQTGADPSGDNVAVTQETILSPTPQLPGVGADDAIVLLAVTAHITDPTPWRTSRSIMILAGEPSPGHPDLLAPRCPLAPDRALYDAMRGSGHPPLAEQINTGQLLTGWVPVAVPRDAHWLTLSLRHEQPNGYVSTDSPLMQR